MVRRLVVVVTALVAVVLGAAAAVRLTSARAPRAIVTTPMSVRYAVVHMDRSLASFGTSNTLASGTLQLRLGRRPAIEHLSVVADGIDLPEGATGPIAIAPAGAGAVGMTDDSRGVRATFTADLTYPLLARSPGTRSVNGDAVSVKPQKASAILRLRTSGGQWEGTLELEPLADGAETGPALGPARLDIASPMAYLPDPAAVRRIVCVNVISGRATSAEQAAVLAELRRAWDLAGVAVLSGDEIARLNADIAASPEALGEAAVPSRIPAQPCIGVALSRSGAAGADIAALTVNVAVQPSCGASSAGLIAAHLLGHVLLREGADDPARTPANLMASACPTGSSLDEDQLGSLWADVAVVSPKIQDRSGRSLENLVAGRLDALLTETPPAVTDVSPPPSKQVFPRSPAGPAPSRRPTPRPTTRPTATSAGPSSPTPAASTPTPVTSAVP